ncbi:MAG TPA: hypothetical protein VK453_23250 [Micromonosporaceae bacterium]|nr:hypothetical protein [Micromonosporaceae bacterium]
MIIPARFNGPPGSANGGYTAGMLACYEDLAAAAAAAADGVPACPIEAVVTLHRPPPLERPMSLSRDGAVLSVYDGESLIATAERVSEPVVETVPPVSFAEALALADSYPGLISHPFPTCFVCGPEHATGLRLFPGRLADGRTAAAWRVPDDVSPMLVFAALDCPGGWSVGIENRPYVLGRFTARVDAVPASGDECVVMGATTSTHGRKAHVVSSMYGPDGGLIATARAVWIAVGR